MAKWQENLAWPRLVMFMVIVFLLLSAVSSLVKTRKPLDLGSQDGIVRHEWCQLAEPLSPHEDGLMTSDVFGNESLLLRQVERLSAAVNVATVSSNDYGDVEGGSEWDSFAKLHEVLRNLFPKV